MKFGRIWEVKFRDLFCSEDAVVTTALLHNDLEEIILYNIDKMKVIPWWECSLLGAFSLDVMGLQDDQKRHGREQLGLVF